MPQTATPLADANALFQEARKLRLKRRFGQNFLINPAIPAGITASLGLSTEDTVVEIGPGAGSLTEHLLSQAGRVFSVEMERDMINHLTRKFNPNAHPDGAKLSLIPCDFLRFDPQPFLDSGELKAPFPIVGNIPYNITTPILFYVCGEVHNPSHPWRQWVKHVTLMIQKEVADRIVAEPGCKAYNHLSIAIQMWFEARLVMNVPPKSFHPAPKVNSAVVQLLPRTEPLVAIDNYEHFSKLIRAAFSQRRKTLRNALIGSKFASAEFLDTMFSTASETFGSPIASSDRAEALSIQSFAALSNTYTRLIG